MEPFLFQPDSLKDLGCIQERSPFSLFQANQSAAGPDPLRLRRVVKVRKAPSSDMVCHLWDPSVPA